MEMRIVKGKQTVFVCKSNKYENLMFSFTTLGHVHKSIESLRPEKSGPD